MRENIHLLRKKYQERLETAKILAEVKQDETYLIQARVYERIVTDLELLLVQEDVSKKLNDIEIELVRINKKLRRLEDGNNN